MITYSAQYVRRIVGGCEHPGTWDGTCVFCGMPDPDWTESDGGRDK